MSAAPTNGRFRRLAEAHAGDRLLPVCPPMRSLRSTEAAVGNSPRLWSRQFSNLRVGPQLPLHIVTASPEDDASGAAGLELGETFAQLLASACEGHLFGGGYIDECVMTVGNVEVMTAVNREVSDVLVPAFDAGQPRFAIWPKAGISGHQTARKPRSSARRAYSMVRGPGGSRKS